MDLYCLIILAAIAEAVWETLKMTWQNGKAKFDRIGALAIGILISIATGLDVLTLINLPSKVPFVGIILTGILISRGSNFVHDILASVNNVHTNTKISTPLKESEVKKVNGSDTET